MFIESSFTEHVFVVTFHSDSEKSLFGILEEIHDYDEKSFMSTLEISLEVLFDIHVEYITRKKYLTETKIGFKKENIITMLDDSRWDMFKCPIDFKREGVELGLNDYSFKLLKQVLALGNYKKERYALLVAMRLMYVLSVQKARSIPVIGFYKTYNTQISAHRKAIDFYYEDLTKEIKGIVTFH